jgi:4-hydroxybenzoate polyprenyltransferase
MNSNDDEESSGTLRAYLQLVRLPNVFTAIADVMMGFLIVRRSFDPRSALVELIWISCSLYLAGMVWNDVFDRDIDAKERPDRPIPSGRVKLGVAVLLGFALLLSAITVAIKMSTQSSNPLPLAITVGIAALVLLYDKWLKHTAIGPLAMGGCRFLNVLLGMSVSENSFHALEWLVAAGLGIYVVGVTLFAKREATQSNRTALFVSVAVMMVGLGLIAAVPKLVVDDWRLGGLPQGWWLFWVVLAAHIVWRCAKAISEPTPLHVQAAVKNCILSIIVIDAAASMMGSGLNQFAFVILVLIVPATFLGRWIYST